MKRFAAAIATAIVLLPQMVSAFSVSPVIIELEGDRGATVKSQVMIRNTVATEQTYYLQTIKFEARENSGAPVFVSPDVDRSGLPEWIALSNTRVTVQAMSQATIPFTVAVPTDVASGSYNAAILVSTTPFDLIPGKSTTIQSKTAVLVLFTVNGETDAQAALLDFLPTSTSRVQVVDADTDYRFRIQNQGNVYVAPTGSVTLTDVFGRVLVREEVNVEGARVLPGMTRTYTGAVKTDLFAIGPVTAVLKLSYAEDAPGLFGSYTYWVLPMFPIVIAVVMLIGLCIGLIAVHLAKRHS